MSTAPDPTGCNCPLATIGQWCQRHRVEKSPHWQRLCRTSPKYFAVWQAGRGPGQKLPWWRRPIGLGDLAHAVIHALRLHWLATWYTRLTGRDCGCQQRKNWLNQFRIGGSR